MLVSGDVFALFGLTPRGASGLKSGIGDDQHGGKGSHPRGVSGLKCLYPFRKGYPEAVSPLRGERIAFIAAVTLSWSEVHYD